MGALKRGETKLHVDSVTGDVLVAVRLDGIYMGMLAKEDRRNEVRKAVAQLEGFIQQAMVDGVL